jgi:hypothetical protein
MQILQSTPAETTAYMIAGFAVIFGMMLVYIASLVIRTRKAKNELENLRELSEVKI